MGNCFGHSYSSSSTSHENNLPSTTPHPIWMIPHSLRTTSNTLVNVPHDALLSHSPKRAVHTNKKSKLAYFHEHPHLLPLENNPLYKLRKL